jgi:hypothetical protein
LSDSEPAASASPQATADAERRGKNILGLTQSRHPAMTLTVEISDQASDADYNAVFKPLLVYNQTHVAAHYESFAIRFRSEAGEIVGGLFARKFYDWLFVEMVFDLLPASSLS